jgi:WD40 repeat protein
LTTPHARWPVQLTCSGDWSCKLWYLSGGASAGAVPPSLTFTHDGVQDAVADIVWSPTNSTLFASVLRDGHVQLWDASSLTPLISETVTVDADMWRAKLRADAADRSARAAKEAAEARRKRRAELGYDEEDEAEEKAAMANAVAAARMRMGGAGGGDGELSDDEGDGKGKRDKGAGGEGGEGGDTAGDTNAAPEDPALLEPPPRKPLTSVLFADTNSQILLTGDATGRVDVYRIVGLDDRMAVTSGGATGGDGGGVDGAGLGARAGESGGLGGARTTGGAPGVGLVIGSEAYEAQMAALTAVLAGMVPAATAAGGAAAAAAGAAAAAAGGSGGV